MTRLASAVLTLSALLFVAPTQAEGLGNPRWQARLQLSSIDGTLDAAAPHLGGSRVLSANLLGDYYLTGSGSSTLRGGLRATGGMLLGPLSMSQSSGGLALGNGPVSAGRRSLLLTGLDAYSLEPSANLSYIGIGYTGHANNSGLAFSADFGLMSGSYSNLRLGRTSAQGFEDAMRDLRFKPLLQLGLSYNY